MDSNFKELVQDRIIVTGANGWLGKRLVNRLLEVGVGHIECIVPPEEDISELIRMEVEVKRADIRDPAALNSIFKGSKGGILFHIAGIIHPERSTEPFQSINVMGTRNAVLAARQAGFRRVVAMSSNSPFGANPSAKHLFNEDSRYVPYMEYGLSKYRMELFLKAAMGLGSMPEIVIIRAPWFYGPGQPSRQTTFFKMVRQGRFPVMGKGANRRSMAYVDNLAHGLMLAMVTSKAAGQIFWIADERPYPMREITETIRDLLENDFGLSVADSDLRVPGVVADVARIADRTIQAFGRYNQKIHVLSEMNLTIACDVARARQVLGYRPEIELREGMRRSISWILNRGWEI